MKAWEYIDGVNGAVAVYRTDCAMFSYRDYNVTASLQCVSLVDTSPIPTCVSSLETDVNTQCIMEYGSSSVISGCIEDWYGTDCDKSCPVINSSVCGGTNGTCEESTHTCSCSSSYLGDACEYINFPDSDLEAYICDTASTLVTCVDDHITPSEMLNMT
ncbi:hypothetical protein ADUPG1_005602, partial [Aduncisulcus paluster]